MSRIRAISLDVGGVLVLPDHGLLSAALDRTDIEHDRSRFAEAHYVAMAAVDRATSEAEDFTDYARAFVAAVGVPAERVDEAHAIVDAFLRTPVWCQPVPGSRSALRRLAAAGLRLAVTSNSGGEVADLLRRHEVVQIGDGPGTQVEVITDSGVLGVAKPDSRMFTATAEALCLAPGAVLHVGDSVHYDVDGAAGAGMVGVHMDPYGLCPSTTHPHVASLADVLELVEDPSPAARLSAET